MKIGITTFWNSSDNYGQQLQCYALQTLLRSWGHDAFLIRYAPVVEYKLTTRQKVVNYIKHPSLLVDYILHYLPIDTKDKREAREEKRLKQINDTLNPKREFEKFREKNLNITPLVYHSYKELKENPPMADVYITGSDQVWHYPYDNDAVYGFFLQFGNEKAIRISYAASIGRALLKKELPVFKMFLKGFDAISVREQSACDLCIEQGYKAQVCIDPTMLLPVDNYKEMAHTPQGNERYAFFYVLNVRKPEEFCLNKIKEYLDNEGLSIKYVNGSGYCQARELIENNTSLQANIPEWIGFIENAQCVFTTSFHGTVFSILMHRPFLTIGLQGKHSSSNTRMVQLLEYLGIPERMLDPQKPICEQMESPINWTKVDERITTLKMSSIDFLRINIG